MGAVCCHSQGHSENAVETLPPLAVNVVGPNRSTKSLHEPIGDKALDVASYDGIEDEQSGRLSILSNFATITFNECGSDLDYSASEVARSMKQRSEELSDAQANQECPSFHMLIKKGDSLLSGKPDFTGVWKCIDTHNLDQFLQDCGVSRLHRLAACKARWPWWSMEHEFDRIQFINHGPLGDIEECIDLTGKEYISYDGKKQKMTNTASWEGCTLIITRESPLGKFREERSLVDDRLEFRLTILNGPKPGSSWGRTFQRVDPSQLSKSFSKQLLKKSSKCPCGWK